MAVKIERVKEAKKLVLRVAKRVKKEVEVEALESVEEVKKIINNYR